MRLETFRGRDLASVSADVRRAFGEDAMIAHSRIVREGPRTVFEIVAADAYDIAEFRDMLEPVAPALGSAFASSRGKPAPFRLALVGPTGSGKTTTAAKLAVHAEAFGNRRVGFLTLDTYRAGALEQLQGYADAAQIPLEIVYEPRELDGALKRLGTCEIIIIDTPGRSPNDAGKFPPWRELLRRIRPAETHLAVPATLRLDLAAQLREEYVAMGATHAILTKLDEVPNDATIAQLAASVSLPTRWITDGQEVPTNLRAAGPRVLGTLGIAPRRAASA